MGKEVNIRPSNNNVSTEQNVTGEYSPIMVVDVPASRKYRISDNKDKRTPLMAKLYDSDGDEITADSELVIGFQAPGKHVPKEHAFLPYNQFSELSVADQSDEAKQKNIQISFDTPFKDYYPDDKIVIMLKSDTQVDWSQGSILRFQLEEIPV